MNEDQLAAIEAAARVAEADAPSPWRWNGTSEIVDLRDAQNGLILRDGSYGGEHSPWTGPGTSVGDLLVTCSPATILALVAEVRRLRPVLAAARTYIIAHEAAHKAAEVVCVSSLWEGRTQAEVNRDHLAAQIARMAAYEALEAALQNDAFLAINTDEMDLLERKALAYAPHNRDYPGMEVRPNEVIALIRRCRAAEITAEARRVPAEIGEAAIQAANDTESHQNGTRMAPNDPAVTASREGA